MNPAGNPELGFLYLLLGGMGLGILGLSIYLACILAPLGAIAVIAVEKPALFNAISPFKVGAAAKSAPVVSFRQQAETRLAAAPGPLLRLSVLADLVKEAEDADDADEQLHFATILHAEAASHMPSTVQHAFAAFKLAAALRAQQGRDDDEEYLAHSVRLLSEAETILRALPAKPGDGMSAMVLADVLAARARVSEGEARLGLLEEVVTLHAAHAKDSGARLPQVRIAFAENLDDEGKMAAAENQFQLAAGDINRLGLEKKRDGHVLALNHALFLMSNQRSDEAMARLSVLLDRPVTLDSGYWSVERSAHLAAAVAARGRGDWRGVREHAGVIKTVRDSRGGNVLTENYTEPRYDLRAALLLLEAERKLGHSQQAEALVTGMREQYQGKSTGAKRCRFDGETIRWRKVTADAVAEIEQREFKCEPAAVIQEAESTEGA